MALHEICYQGSQVAFLTQHGKQELVQSPLEQSLGCQVIHTDAYDTDQLGTFTGDILRQGTQLEAARKKAHIGMALTGLEIGLSSEGAFGGGPFAGFIPWDTEILLWVDKINDLEIVGLAQGPAQSHQKKIQSHDELIQFADEAKFPEHHLVLRPDHQDHEEIVKGIKDKEHLIRTFDLVKAKSCNGMVFVENDLRAFANPTRKELIRKAADNLIQKIRSQCPKCHAPGFWLDRYIPGMPCSVCGSKTHVPIAEVWFCSKCEDTEERPINQDSLADPGRCDICNP